MHRLVVVDVHRQDVVRMVTQKAWLWALSARLQFGNRGVRLVLLGF
jgi:hypothetical protein